MTQSNLWKLILALVVFFGLVSVLVWGPLLTAPDPGPDVHLPSMENVPPSGTHLTIEIQAPAVPTDQHQ